MGRGVAVVTGGGSGIGAGVCQYLAEGGYSVAVLDRDKSAAERIAAGIRKAGHSAEAVICDVSDEPQIDRSIEVVVRDLGTIDALVNNAGFTRDKHFLEMTVEDWDSIHATHLRGSFLMTKVVSKIMSKQGSGRIVNISSISARGDTDRANYVAAKSGLEGLTRASAADLAHLGITVNAIGPGVIETAMSEVSAARAGRSLAEHLAVQAQQIPVGRVGRPHDVARAVDFFLAPDADFITGQVLYVSGGPHG